MQPNNPYMSCCGEADAFEADAFEVAGAQYVAIITNGKGSSRTERESLFPTKKRDEGNPTGHGIMSLTPTAKRTATRPPGGI
jgi:hypothetical protein